MLKSLIPIIIKIASQLADALIKGENIGTDGVKGIKTGYYEAHNWLQDVVDATENTYDNDSLNAFFRLCEDSAQEGGFELQKP